MAIHGSVINTPNEISKRQNSFDTERSPRVGGTGAPSAVVGGHLSLGMPSFPPHLHSTVVLVDNSDKVGLITGQPVF